MSAGVTLEIVAGAMRGRRWSFEDHDTLLCGRSSDCQACLSDDSKVSRHHLLLEVNPPDVCVRDLGSLNGTYVNGVKHGGRERGETPEEGARRRYPEVSLEEGDRLRVGDSVLEVRIAKPPPHRAEPVRCRKCGRDVSREAGADRPGDFVCAACRALPEELIRRLLARARAGTGDLVAVRGYTILKKLGQGGMGVVYLARHDASGEQTALKVMLPRVAVNPRARDQFLREVEISKLLKHRNIVQLRDSGCSEGTFFFTQEFCDGGSVDKLMARRGGSLPMAEATRIILETLEGLAYAHDVENPIALQEPGAKEMRGVVHRDLSPQNILLRGGEGTRIAKLADFGLAKAFELAGLSGGTRTGDIAGKPVFIPRQQVVQYKYAQPDVDVWAAAACLYNMLTGRFPRDFRPGRDPWQTILDASAVPIRRRDPSIPRRLAEVIDHALIDKPEISFKTAAALSRAIEGAL